MLPLGWACVLIVLLWIAVTILFYRAVHVWKGRLRIAVFGCVAVLICVTMGEFVSTARSLGFMSGCIDDECNVTHDTTEVRVVPW